MLSEINWNAFWQSTADQLAPYNAIINASQALFACVNLAALFLLWVQIRSTRKQAVKDDIVSAGRHGDEIYGSLFGSGALNVVVRRVYGDEIEKIEEYLKAHPGTPPAVFHIEEYWYVRRIFAHVARMAVLAESKGVKDYFDRWIAELVLRMKESIILRALAVHSLYSESWNLAFRDRIWEKLKELDMDNFKSSRHNMGMPSEWKWPAP